MRCFCKQACATPPKRQHHLYSRPTRVFSCGQVVRCSLENAASVAKTFLTSDVVVTEIPEPEPANAGAGMDAMGGY